MLTFYQYKKLKWLVASSLTDFGKIEAYRHEDEMSSAGLVVAL